VGGPRAAGSSSPSWQTSETSRSCYSPGEIRKDEPSDPYISLIRSAHDRRRRFLLSRRPKALILSFRGAEIAKDLRRSAFMPYAARFCALLRMTPNASALGFAAFAYGDGDMAQAALVTISATLRRRARTPHAWPF